MVKLRLESSADLSAERCSAAPWRHGPLHRRRLIMHRSRSTSKSLPAELFASATGMDMAGCTGESRCAIDRTPLRSRPLRIQLHARRLIQLRARGRFLGRPFIPKMHQRSTPKSTSWASVLRDRSFATYCERAAARSFLMTSTGSKPIASEKSRNSITSIRRWPLSTVATKD